MINEFKFFFTNKEEYHRRYDICKSCDRFNNLTKQCKECNCFMPMKCKISNLPCPLGYWDFAENISETDNLKTL